MEKDEQKQQGNEQQNDQPKGQPVDTVEFVKSILEQLGCKYEVNPNNPSEMMTTYQGEKFIIIAVNRNSFIRVFHPCWYIVDWEDLEGIVDAKRAINEANGTMPGYTMVFEMNEAEKMMAIHTLSEFLMIPLPNYVGYFQHVMSGFFIQKKNFAQCLEAIKKADSTEKGN